PFQLRSQTKVAGRRVMSGSADWCQRLAVRRLAGPQHVSARVEPDKATLPAGEWRRPRYCLVKRADSAIVATAGIYKNFQRSLESASTTFSVRGQNRRNIGGQEYTGT